MVFALTFIANALGNFVLGLLVAWFLGPEGFGIYAVGIALTLFFNALFLEWVKHVATRFYVPSVAAGNIRPLLDRLLVTSIGVLLAAAAGAMLAGVNVSLSIAAFWAAAVAGAAFGCHDYQQVLLRAEKAERTYLGVVLIRNGLMIIALIILGWWLQSAASLIAAAGLSAAVGAAVGRWAAPRSSQASTSATAGPEQQGPSVRALAQYALPLIAASATYGMLMLVSRWFVAHHFGTAEAGKLAFAADVGIKLLCTVSATIEVALLARTVGIAETRGNAAAHRRISQTTVIGLAIMAPLAAGYVVILPAWEQIIAPPAFRDKFSIYSLLLMPTFLALSLAQACLSPALLIEKKTMATASGAVIALAVALAGLMAARSPETAALAISAGYAAGFLWIAGMAWRITAARPRLRDVAIIIAAAGLMAAALWPFRTLGQPLTTIPLMGLVGAALYMTLLFVFNVGHIRLLLKLWQRKK